MFRFQVGIALVALIMLAASVEAQDAPRASREYLRPELRARVVQLKSDVAHAKTDEKTVFQRADVLWDWANAFALAGGLLPVELPLTIGMVTSREPGWKGIALYPPVYVDRYVRELSIREDNPAAIGTLASSITEPMLADTYQTIVQTYTAGDLGMAVGGSILLARHFMSNQGQPYQSDKPAADNYITIKCSNPKAKFVPVTQQMSGMHGGFRSMADTLAFRLEGTALKKGDTVAITYGDKSGGSKGFRIQTHSNDCFPLPVYVDVLGEEIYFTLPIIAHRVVGGPVAGVHGFAPSIIRVGEPFEFSMRSEDRFSNRATGNIPAYQVTLNGEPFKSISASTEPITLLSNVKIDRPGVYRFAFRSTDGKISGIANPIWVLEDPQYRIYWGEMHGHCGFAEGQGTPDGFFTFGLEDARLDFLTLTEHDLWMDDWEWKTLGEKVKQYHKEGSFITFLGHEWTQDTGRGGHHNVFFRTPDNRKRANVQRAPLLSQLYQTLRNENDLQDVLIVPHAHEAGEWRMNDPDLEKLVEIMSMHGTFQWYGQRFLDQGHEVGFIAASDDHLSHPGYSGTQARGLFQRGGLAAVLAPTKTNDAIFDNLRALHTYATTGERIILDVTTNGAMMGTRIPPDKRRQIHGKVMGTAPIENVTVFKNGAAIWSEDYLPAKKGVSDTALVTFYSDSEPFGRANPRALKTWTGSLTVNGAKLQEAKLLRDTNVLTERAAIDPKDANRVNFTILTRGRDQSILLRFDGATSKTEITVSLDEGVEMSPGTAVYNVIARLPASTETFSFSDMKNGQVGHEYPVMRYKDRISVRAVELNVPLDREFEYTDVDELGQGDYYFVRATQLGGGMAWSSPVWIGGFRAR